MKKTKKGNNKSKEKPRENKEKQVRNNNIKKN